MKDTEEWRKTVDSAVTFRRGVLVEVVLVETVYEAATWRRTPPCLYNCCQIEGSASK